MPSNMVKVYPVLDWFAKRMEFKLVKNDWKPFWREEPGFDEHMAFKRLKEETDELKGAFADYHFYPNWDHAQAVINEAADVANFAMMIADFAFYEAYKLDSEDTKVVHYGED